MRLLPVFFTLLLSFNAAIAQDSAYLGGAQDTTQTVVIPKMKRWSVHGVLGFNFDNDTSVNKEAWTYSMVESPVAGLGARFRINPQTWDHFNFFARTDLVYSQRQWNLQTAYASSSLTDSQLVVKAFGEASWHPHFAHWLAMFLGLGVQSPPLYRNFNLSTRGYTTDLLTPSVIGFAGQVGFAYMAGGGLVFSLSYDYANTDPQVFSSVLAGMSYGL